MGKERGLAFSVLHVSINILRNLRGFFLFHFKKYALFKLGEFCQR